MTDPAAADRLPVVLSVELNRSSAVPLYRQLAEALETAIRDGVLPSGAMVEAEVDMAARLGLSRPTVRRGIQELVEQGLIVRSRGTGTQVRPWAQLDGGSRPARRGLIGLVVPDASNPFFGEIATIVQRQARQRGYLTIMADSDEHRETERELLRSLRGRVDGLIVAAPRLDDDALQRLLSGTNCVIINHALPQMSSVIVDVSIGMRQAAAHLIALGHRQVGYVGGPVSSRSGRVIEAALRDECTAAGCEFTVVGRVAPDHRGGYSAGDQVYSCGATAVVAYNDLVATGVMARLLERGARVPDDISLIGTDDIPSSAMLTPSLTSVAIDREAVARSALDQLIARLDRPGRQAGSVSVASQLVVRASTGSVTSRRPATQLA
ncbi:MAG: GntR family transcriptional regulator [Propionicimonas sp.]